MIVTISGYNASGKSTLAREVVRRLQARGVPSRHARFDALYPTSLFKKKKRRAALPKDAASVELRAIQGRHASWNRRMRWYHCANLLCVGIVLWVVRRLWRDTVVVFDRYFYDRLIHFRASGLWYGIARRLAPSPDVGFVLLPDLAVWEARMLDRLGRKYQLEGARIASGDLDSIARVWEHFRRLAVSAGSVHVIDSGDSAGIESAWALIEGRMPARLAMSRRGSQESPSTDVLAESEACRE